MLDVIKNYSGIFAIIVYALVLVIILAFKKDKPEDEQEDEKEERTFTPLDVNDEDATVACLVAAIDLREQTGKNVQVLSVREVK